MTDNNIQMVQDEAPPKKNVIFNQEESLGKVVSEKKLICNLGVDQILDFERRLQFSCGFDKLGFLCGFKFVSNKADVKNKTFFVVFVPKLKSKIMRQQARGRSSWYIWEFISQTDVKVLSQTEAFNTYGFDIDLFFQSDLFKIAIPKFVKTVKTCLETQVEDHIKKLEASDDHSKVLELQRYIRAIKDSLPTLSASENASETFNLGNSDNGEQKAYRANKSYNLDHFQRRQQLDKLKTDFKAWLAAKNKQQNTDATSEKA